MLEIDCDCVIVFEKSDLINVPRRVYTHEMRQLFLTQNTGSRQVQNRETTNEKRKFACMFDKGKTFTYVKSFVFTTSNILIYISFWPQ